MFELPSYPVVTPYHEDFKRILDKCIHNIVRIIVNLGEFVKSCENTDRWTLFQPYEETPCEVSTTLHCIPGSRKGVRPCITPTYMVCITANVTLISKSLLVYVSVYQKSDQNIKRPTSYTHTLITKLISSTFFKSGIMDSRE